MPIETFKAGFYRASFDTDDPDRGFEIVDIGPEIPQARLTEAEALGLAEWAVNMVVEAKRRRGEGLRAGVTWTVTPRIGRSRA